MSEKPDLNKRGALLRPAIFRVPTDTGDVFIVTFYKNMWVRIIDTSKKYYKDGKETEIIIIEDIPADIHNFKKLEGEYEIWFEEYRERNRRKIKLLEQRPVTFLEPIREMLFNDRSVAFLQYAMTAFGGEYMARVISDIKKQNMSNEEAYEYILKSGANAAAFDLALLGFFSILAKVMRTPAIKNGLEAYAKHLKKIKTRNHFFKLMKKISMDPKLAKRYDMANPEAVVKWFSKFARHSQTGMPKATLAGVGLARVLAMDNGDELAEGIIFNHVRRNGRFVDQKLKNDVFHIIERFSKNDGIEKVIKKLADEKLINVTHSQEVLYAAKELVDVAHVSKNSIRFEVPLYVEGKVVRVADVLVTNKKIRKIVEVETKNAVAFLYKKAYEKEMRRQFFTDLRLLDNAYSQPDKRFRFFWFFNKDTVSGREKQILDRFEKWIRDQQSWNYNNITKDEAIDIVHEYIKFH